MKEAATNLAELDKYLEMISRYPLITPERELALARLLQEGSPDEVANARDEFIQANLRLVIKIALEYANCGLDLSDLVSEGNLGLIKAVERFRPLKGAKFSTYASFWIRQRIRRALSNQARTIRIPVHQLDRLRKVARLKGAMERSEVVNLSDREIAEKIGLSPEKLKETLSLVNTTVSLDEPVGREGDGRNSVLDVLPDQNVIMPDESTEETEMISFLNSKMDGLNPRQQDILTRRFGLNGKDPETLETIGFDYKVTRERIRQIEADAIRVLRKSFQKMEHDGRKAVLLGAVSASPSSLLPASAEGGSLSRVLNQMVGQKTKKRIDPKPSYAQAA